MRAKRLRQADPLALLRRLAEGAPGQAAVAAPEGPDSRLVGLCMEIVECAGRVNALRCQLRRMPSRDSGELAAAHASLLREIAANRARIRTAAMRARCLPAVGGAGIFAKATAVRATVNGSPRLALSLAEDLVRAPGLRAALWPATLESCPAPGGGA